MAWQKIALKAAMEINKRSEGKFFIVIIFIAMIPLLLLVAMFSGGTTINGESDLYEQAFKKTSCDSSYYYQMEDVRFFDMYTYPPGITPEDADDITDRLKNDYFNMKTNGTSYPTGGVSRDTCILKSDEEILEVLNTKYNVSKDLNNEILESIRQIRNGRQNFTYPLKEDSIPRVLSTWDDKVTGIEFASDADQDVLAIADGVVIEIETSSDVYYTRDKDGNIKSNVKGLTVLLQHEVIRGINMNGEYDTTTMYSYYTNLKNVTLGVGDKVEQKGIIGKNKKENIYFEVWDLAKKKVDPELYMFLPTEKYGSYDKLPMELPFSITSLPGARDLDKFHYGLDLDKEYGATIFSVTAGEVVYASNTCSPDGGPTNCPASGPVAKGGNAVVIKTSDDLYFTYAHLTRTTLKVGDNVHEGQVIGFQGNSGNSYGSHLHLEIHKGGMRIADLDSMIEPQSLINFDVDGINKFH